MHESCPIFNNSRPSDRDGRHNGLRAHTSKARRPVCLALWRPHSSGTSHISKETYICEKSPMKETNICEKSHMKETYIFEKSPMKETTKACRPRRLVCLALWRPHSSGTLHISKETYICEKRWMKETNICEKSPMKKTYIFEKSPMKETAKACCPIRLSIWRSHRITYIRYVKRDLNM